ncbi:MAG TPA: hypothetical protein PLM75_11615, partial [bacterium]|nr:hypothetical protein [bacterium]
MRKYLFNLFFICALAFYLIGCGSTEKPQVPTLPALASSQTLNITFIDEYTGKAVWGENITSAEDIFGFTNQEETLRSNCQSGAIGGFVISSGILNVWYSGTNTANRRRPNIGLRTGEEPMMNMVTDALLYYARKNYTKTTGNINIRVAVHNGGGI